MSQLRRIELEIHRLHILSLPAAFVAAGSAAAAAAAVGSAAAVEAVPAVVVKMTAACVCFFRYSEIPTNKRSMNLNKLDKSTHLKQSNLHEILLIWSDFG